MENTPILKTLLKYVEEKNAPFSMPGHKSGRGFMNTEEGKAFYKIMLQGDITEVEGLDNLHHPEGMINEALMLLEELYGSKKSYFLVNGSTSGNLAMIFSAFEEGDKVLVERNCHRSIFNGIVMRKLQPVYVNNYISNKYNAPISIDMEHFLQVLQENDDIKGVIVTYPNYYGIACDLKSIIDVCKEKRIKVLVDCAHGAHFGVSPLLPENPMKIGAYMAVMSAHKTLPSLTQTAYLHIGDEVDKEKVDFYVSAFSSTSPSYVLMAAMDYGRFYLSKYGKKDFEECIRITDEYRTKINGLTKFNALNQEDISAEGKCYNIRIDRTRLVINVEKGYNVHRILEYLRLQGVQCEMSDGYNLVLIASPFNTTEDFEKLYGALAACPMEQFKDKYFQVGSNSIPEMASLPWQAIHKEREFLKFKDSMGRISADNIVPYPPGVPLIMMGEIIDENTINMIQYYISNGVTVLGIEGQEISVIKA